MKRTAPNLIRQRIKTALVAIAKAKLEIESADTIIHQQRIVVYKLNRKLIDQGEIPVDSEC